VHGFGCGPGRGESLGPGAGVVDLRSEEEIGVTIDDEGVASVALLEVREIGRLRVGSESGYEEDGDEAEDGADGVHDGCS
jgi:hypothetical protein